MRDDIRRLREDRADAAFLTEFGQRLYAALFEGAAADIGRLFDRCCGTAQRSDGRGIRLRLKIEDPAAAAIPWEFMYSSADTACLATSIRTPIVRQIPRRRHVRNLEAKPPLRVLVAIPSNDAASGIDVLGERRRIEEALTNLRGLVNLEVIDSAVTYSALQHALWRQPYHVFHFIGHGRCGGGRAWLALDGEDGGVTEWVDDHRFAGLFENHATMKLVVLNACQGAAGSESDYEVGVAHQVTGTSVPAVVAMQFDVFEQEALCFADAFYYPLFQGYERGRVDVAISHARSALARRFPGSRAVGMPVLFLRANTGVLFNIVEGSARDNFPLTSRQLDTAQEVHQTYEESLADLRARRREVAAQGQADRPSQQLVAAELDQEIAQQERQRAAVERRIRLRHLALGSTVMVAVVAALAMWLYAFDVPERAVKSVFYTTWVGQLAPEPLIDPRIAVVAISDSSERYFGLKYGRPWRAMHARLIDSIAGKARVIALDMLFSSDSDAAADSALARAIERARAKRTTVYVGVDSFAGGQPLIAPSLRAAVARHWSSVCLYDDSRFGAKEMPLLTLRADRGPYRRVPSLSFAAAMTLEFGDSINPFEARVEGLQVVSGGGSPFRPVPASELVVVSRQVERCRIPQRGDTVAELLVTHAPTDSLRAPTRWFPYERILEPRGRPVPSLDGKIVFVGVAGTPTYPDSHRVQRGFRTELRHGVEIHADAANTILNRVVRRPLSTLWQIVVIAMFAAMGCVAGYAERPWIAGRRHVWLATAFTAYLALAAYLYIEHNLLLDLLYPAAALLGSFVAVRTTNRRLL